MNLSLQVTFTLIFSAEEEGRAGVRVLSALQDRAERLQPRRALDLQDFPGSTAPSDNNPHPPNQSWLRIRKGHIFLTFVSSMNPFYQGGCLAMRKCCWLEGESFQVLKLFKVKFGGRGDQVMLGDNI